mgnify:CR=1 FL=1
MTIDAGKVGLAQALVVQVAHNFADAVLAWLKIARMPHQITKRTHVANIALTHKLFGLVVYLTCAMFARIEVDAGSSNVIGDILLLLEKKISC